MIRRRTVPRPKALWYQAKMKGKPKPKKVVKAVKRQARPRPRSKAMTAKMVLYRAAKTVFLAANPQCVCGPPCTAPATEIHHSRGRAGLLLLDQRHWRAVCRDCHNLIGSYPVWARQRGMLCEAGKWNKYES